MSGLGKAVAKSGANGDQIGAKVRIRSAGLRYEPGANLYCAAGQRPLKWRVRSALSVLQLRTFGAEYGNFDGLLRPTFPYEGRTTSQFVRCALMDLYCSDI